MLFKKNDLIAILIIGEVFALSLLPVARNLELKIGYFTYVVLVLMPVFALLALYAFYLFSRSRRPVFFEIGKFSAVGALNTAIDFGTLNLLSHVFNIHHGAGVAFFNVIAVSLAIINSYCWNKYWTFGQGAGGGAKNFIQFVFVSVIGVAINTAAVYFLTTFIAAPGGLSGPAWENVAKFIGTPLYLTWNFFGYKLWVFKK